MQVVVGRLYKSLWTFFFALMRNLPKGAIGYTLELTKLEPNGLRAKLIFGKDKWIFSKCYMLYLYHTGYSTPIWYNLCLFFTRYGLAKGKILLNLNPSLAQEKNFRMLQIFHACDIVRQNSSALKQVRSSIITTLSLYICIYTLP